MSTEYARLAPDWAASTAPLPVLRLGAGRHRAPGGRRARRRQQAGLTLRQQLVGAVLFAVVHLGAPGATS